MSSGELADGSAYRVVYFPREFTDELTIALDGRRTGGSYVTTDSQAENCRTRCADSAVVADALILIGVFLFVFMQLRGGQWHVQLWQGQGAQVQQGLTAGHLR